MNNKISLWLLLWILLLVQPHYAMQPEALCRTYECFTSTARHISPLNGAIAWESGLIKNIFDMGVTCKPDKEHWLTHSDGPVRMARSLFSINGHNFDISTNTNYPAVHLGVSTIAQLIVQLEQSRVSNSTLEARALENMVLLDPAFAQSMYATKNEYEITAARYDQEIKVKDAAKKCEDEVRNLKESRSIALNKLDTQRLCQDWTRAHSIEALRKQIADIDLLKGSEKNKAQKERTLKSKQLEAFERAKNGGDYNRVFEFVQAIVDSQEQSGNYPDDISYQILLAALYRKAKTVADIRYYMNEVERKLSCICSQTGTVVPTLPQPLEILLDSPALLYNPTCYEKLVLSQISTRYYNGRLPKIAEYSIIQSSKVEFADCAETTLRNFCNCVLYNGQTKRFDLTKTGCKVSQALVEFYSRTDFQVTMSVACPEAHAVWASFCQHQPYITYRKLVYLDTHNDPIVLTAGKETDGFIYGPSGTHQEIAKIGSRQYTIVDPSQCYLCEMHPTLRNFIIMIDRFFNLNLFSHRSFADACADPQFNAHYFPLLCSHFEILKDKHWSASECETLDVGDYTAGGMTLSFDLIDLFLNNEHAEIFPKTEKQTLIDLGPTLAKHLLEKHGEHDASLERIVPLFPLSAHYISQEHPLRWLLYLNLAEPNTKIDAIIMCLKRLSEGSLSTGSQKFILNALVALLQLLEQRPDWYYHKKLFGLMAPEYFSIPQVRTEIDGIVAQAKRGLDGNIAWWTDLAWLFSELVRKNVYISDAVEVAQQLSSRHEDFDHSDLDILVKELALKGKIIS